ncbi:MAG: hypothetical protein AAF317_07180 [Pseudomonadota bacterium]
MTRILQLLIVALSSAALAHDPPSTGEADAITKALAQIGCTAEPDDVIEHEGNFEVMLATCDDGDFFIELSATFDVIMKIKQ